MSTESQIIQNIAKELNLKEYQVVNVHNLLFEEECTIPFVARYRKEMTGSLDEDVLRTIRDRVTYLEDLEHCRAKYLKVIIERAESDPNLKEQLPALKEKFAATQTKQELEDLYLPFKPKRRTRGQMAKEKGFEPLLELILEKRADLDDIQVVAKTFLQTQSTDQGAAVESSPADITEQAISEALKGAGDILAERWNETAELRARVREVSEETATLVSKKIELAAPAGAGSEASSDAPEPGNEAVPTRKKASPAKKAKQAQKQTKYENYYDFAEPMQSVPSHRVMAIRRGDSEKVLRMSIEVDTEQVISEMSRLTIQAAPTSEEAGRWLHSVLEDTYKRLTGPSIETELRLKLKARAEQEAIRVFAENLEKLLLLPPIPGKVTLGVDPGLRTGSKLAVVSPTGQFLSSSTIYPEYSKKESGKTKEAVRVLLKLVKDYSVEYIAVGNGTGSKEIDRFISATLKAHDIKGIKRLVINEAGASVYSTDPVAKEEFPDLDPTIRSAVSIARRLQDPLAELVKIDPRSIGVGQYQHDVNVTKLRSSLEEVVESCVNKVGVNVNTASYKLLGYVSGIGPALAKAVVAHRDTSGAFNSRKALEGVSGFGPKSFQQAAGFLRVPDSEVALDNSSVHPESYGIVEGVAADMQLAVKDLLGKSDLVGNIPWENYVTPEVGMPTLTDIAQEMIKPGRDPRDEGTRLIFSDDVDDLESLTVGMKLKGTVTNVTNFGAFVDIGVHQDGLVHISELSDEFVSDPQAAVSIGDIVDVTVIDVDCDRRRISLSCRSDQVRAEAAQQQEQRGQRRGPRRPQNSNAQGQGSDQERSERSQQRSRGGQQRNFRRGPGKQEGQEQGERSYAQASGDRRPHRSAGGNQGGRPQGNNRPQRGQRGKGGGRNAPQQSFTMDDLLNKFNK